MATNSQRNDERFLRAHLPIPLPRNTPINLRYSQHTDTLTVMLGAQDRWPPQTKVEGNTTVHVAPDGKPVRVELSRASKVFPVKWLEQHMRSSGPRKKLGLP